MLVINIQCSGSSFVGEPAPWLQSFWPSQVPMSCGWWQEIQQILVFPNYRLDLVFPSPKTQSGFGAQKSDRFGVPKIPRIFWSQKCVGFFDTKNPSDFWLPKIRRIFCIQKSDGFCEYFSKISLIFIQFILLLFKQATDLGGMIYVPKIWWNIFPSHLQGGDKIPQIHGSWLTALRAKRWWLWRYIWQSLGNDYLFAYCFFGGMALACGLCSGVWHLMLALN